ncbi:MAG: cytochrome c [Rhodospirillales bacterium]|jgi:cytochrome c6|nr:cytochrome c [Rhodospirillales bacterium]
MIAMVTSVSVSSQDLEIGKRLWISECAFCHGEQGKPIFPLAPDISLGEGNEKSSSQQFDIVLYGTDIMPSSVGKIREEHISEIITYMRTLYPKMSPPLILSDPNFM